MTTLIHIVYIPLLLAIGLFGILGYILLLFFWIHRSDEDILPPLPADPAEWPRITVQLPIFNEKFVLERLVEAVAALDYPKNRLQNPNCRRLHR